MVSRFGGRFKVDPTTAELIRMNGDANDALDSARKSQSYATGDATDEHGNPYRPGQATDNAKYYKENAEQHKESAEAWAIGKRNGVPVTSSDETYENNSKYWSDMAKLYGTGGAHYISSVMFANIPTSGMVSGDIYNIEDDFITDNRFQEGAGINVKAGTNIIYNVYGKWDLQAISGGVTGIKGNAENTYREGNVNITPEDIGYFSASTMSIGGTVPPASVNDANKALKGDGTWGDVIPEDMTGATATTDGTHGLIKQPHAGDQDKVFQGNGTWGHKLQIDIVKQNGVYGYIDSGGNFVSFKSQADIDAAVAAAMVGTATAADVKEGVTFTNSLQSGLTGTFAAQEKTVTAGTSAASVTPDSGKYLSKVTYNPTPSQEKSTTASRSAQTITPDSGKLLSKVSIAKYPDASGTYTPTANSSASDMGKTNDYRYVDTRTVYNLGSSAGLSSGYTTIAQISSSGGSASAGYNYSVTKNHYYLVVLFNVKGCTIVRGATSIKTGGPYNTYFYYNLIKATSTTVTLKGGAIGDSGHNSWMLLRLY